MLNEDFIKESIDRTINSKYKKVFHDLNPMWAEHWYYNNILNSYKGINYCHFVITDNNALSDDVIKKLFSEYNKDSVWFKRDILGQRIASEGIIFKQINERPADYIANYEQVKKCHKIIIGLDFGGSKSNTAIVACGFFDKTIIVIKSILIPTNSTIVFIAQKLKEFISDLKQITTARIVSVQADNENQIAIATLLTYRLGVPILNCNKRKIIERIRLKEKLLNSKQYFFYMPDAKTALESSKRQLWSDKNRDTRLDDGLIDIDSADAEEYCWTSIPFLFI
ncbi:MAG: hypothetical protein LBF97_01315 [Elusimicrobiota bacterium]|nr:hypothetical protein [Elusimicrobiota bacterium]